MNRLLQAAREALAYVRGDCAHQWEKWQDVTLVGVTRNGWTGERMPEADCEVSGQSRRCHLCGIKETRFMKKPRR